MFTWIDYTFWAIETLAYVCVLLFMVRARSLTQWSSLTAFCSSQIVVSAALFLLHTVHNWPVYFYTQWYSEILLSLLKLLILWQVILASISSLRLVPRGICLGFLVSILIVGAFSFAIGLRGILRVHELPATALILNRAACMAVVGIFSTFAAFSSTFGLRWRSRGLQIDLGLNVIAAIDLLCFLAETSLSGKLYLSYRIESAIHIISLCIWCRAFISPETVTPSMTEEMRHTIRQMSRELHQKRSR